MCYSYPVPLFSPPPRGRGDEAKRGSQETRVIGPPANLFSYRDRGRMLRSMSLGSALTMFLTHRLEARQRQVRFRLRNLMRKLSRNGEAVFNSLSSVMGGLFVYPAFRVLTNQEIPSHLILRNLEIGAPMKHPLARTGMVLPSSIPGAFSAHQFHLTRLFKHIIFELQHDNRRQT